MSTLPPFRGAKFYSETGNETIKHIGGAPDGRRRASTIKHCRRSRDGVGVARHHKLESLLKGRMSRTYVAKDVGLVDFWACVQNEELQSKGRCPGDSVWHPGFKCRPIIRELKISRLVLKLARAAVAAHVGRYKSGLLDC